MHSLLKHVAFSSNMSSLCTKTDWSLVVSNYACNLSSLGGYDHVNVVFVIDFSFVLKHVLLQVPLDRAFGISCILFMSMHCFEIESVKSLFAK